MHVLVGAARAVRLDVHGAEQAGAGWLRAHGFGGAGGGVGQEPGQGGLWGVITRGPSLSWDSGVRPLCRAGWLFMSLRLLYLAFRRTTEWLALLTRGSAALLGLAVHPDLAQHNRRTNRHFAGPRLSRGSEDARWNT